MKKHLPSDFDQDLDGDTVWSLVDRSSNAQPSPTFVENTLRRTRLAHSEKTSLWQKFFSPIGLLGTSSAALAALALVFTLNSQPSVSTPDIVIQDEPTQEWTELEDVLATELLVSATEDPSLFSDAEVIALLF